ncbi:MAG: hypothetical protein FJZ95_08595 [Chloroflexi bacterium]|nr:hypothetical protein [Chloroflexota bacterium]
MAVPEEMREIEKGIDSAIESKPIWQCPRSVLLRRFLEYYRDSIRLLQSLAVMGAQTRREIAVKGALGLERDLRAGVWRCLLWAMQIASESGKRPMPTDEEIIAMSDVGRDYEVVVDFLKVGKHGLVDIAVNRRKRIITIYEGGDLTGADWALIEHEQATAPSYSHVDLTADTDRLTGRWTAGAFRATVGQIRDLALKESDNLEMRLDAKSVPVAPLPTIIEVPDFSDRMEQAVIEDLTLTPSIAMGPDKWNLYAWLDTPLVEIGEKRFGVSDMLIALGTDVGYDHMLRLAARVDPKQYSKVSGLREERMMEACREELEKKGWDVRTSAKLSGFGFEAIKDHVAFYPSKMEACYVDDEMVSSQPGDFYGGWITKDIVGPFKGEPGTGFW